MPSSIGAATYTIDELAAASGVPSRTIRFYQAKGVLPAPERRGRVALYGPAHVDRLKLVALMQERGLRLRAIKDLLSLVGEGDLSIEDWLGLGERLQTPWSEDAPALMTDADLRALTGGAASAEELERLGWAEPREGLPRRYYVRSPALLSLGVALAHAGVDLATAAKAEAILRRGLSKAATDLVALFETEVRDGISRGMKAADLTRALDALRPMASDAVRLVFAQEIERAVTDMLDRGTISRRSASAPRRARR